MNRHMENAVDTLRYQIEQMPKSREASLAMTKLDECVMWIEASGKS